MLDLVVVSLLLCVLLVGCSTAPKKESTEQELYEDAKRSIKLRNFPQATLALEELESRFPFGQYAEQAQLDRIYARYSGLDLEGSILAAERFIRLHPQSPSVDYAYYVRGVANYNLDIGVSSQYFSTAGITSRVPGHMRLAFIDFSELLIRFPASAYAVDAQKRKTTVANAFIVCVLMHPFGVSAIGNTPNSLLQNKMWWHLSQHQHIEDYFGTPTTDRQILHIFQFLAY